MSSNSTSSSNNNNNNRDSDDMSNSANEALVDFVSGGISGTVAKLIEYPADTVKTRMQSGFYEGKSAFRVCADIIKKEGALRGFYSGVAMPVLGCAAECAVAFSVFNYTTTFLLSDPAARRFFSLEQHRDQNAYSVVAMSGAMAGIANAIMLTPVEVVKCRIQANPQKYPNVRQCVRVSTQEEGWKCFASGFSGTFAREIPGSIGFFIMLEWSMRTFFSQYRVSHEEFITAQREREERKIDAEKIHHHSHHHHAEQHDSFVCPGELKEDAPWHVRPICGGFAGFGLVALPFPADTIKTVLQISPEAARMGFFATGRDLVKKSGWKILFRGLPITMLRAFPGNAAVFSTYDLVSNYLLRKI